MFEGKHGDMVVFQVKRAPEYRNNNDLAVYPVDDVLDMVDRQVYSCAGKCRVESRPGGVRVDCTAWKKPDRLAICATGRFMGDGMWKFKPQRPESTTED